MTIQNSKLNTIQKYILLSTFFLLPVYLIKIKFYWASSNALEFLISILILIWIFNKNAKYKILNTQYSIPVALIFVGLILSTLANNNYYSGFGVLKGWFIYPIIFAIIFLDQLKRDDSLLSQSLRALFFSGVAISIIGIIYKFLGIVTYDGRLKIFWDSPNQLAMFLAVPFLIGASNILLPCPRGGVPPFARGGTEGWERLMGILGLLLIALNLYFTQSFGAWLALAAALIVYFWLKYKESVKKKYFFIILLTIILFLGLSGYAKFEQIKSLGNRSSFASREMIWRSAGKMIRDNPLFGIGPGNFQDKYLEYQKYFPPYLEWSAPQPHNIYLAFWLESGLVGLAGFIWLLILFFRDNIKTRRIISPTRDMGILFLAIIIYILVHGLIDTTYWRNDLALVFWVVIVGNIYLSGKIEGIGTPQD